MFSKLRSKWLWLGVVGTLGLSTMLAGVALAVDPTEVGDAGSIDGAAALTIGGASMFLALIMGAIISLLGWTKPENAALKDQFGPFLALVVGVVFVGGLAAVQGANIIDAVLVGIVAGSSSMGVHDTIDAATG